ncbi:hypothetical protein OSG_eHP30_00080 [environmental Halophage eHP-30]|nr:hypothetical protein OSG_eHP30_00080 [environmental Halophage eHP-30]
MIMQLQILGSGSSGNGYIIQNDNEALVLEAGVSHKEMLPAINYRPDRVKAFLVSHMHGDHAKYLRQYQWTLFGHELGHCNILEPYSHFTYQPFDVEHDASNQAFLIKHPDMGSLFYLSDAAYIPAKINGLNHLLIEANYSEDILARNMEQGIINERLAERIKENHLSIERLEHWLRLIDFSKLKSITLCHLSDKNSDAWEFYTRIWHLTGVPVHIAEPHMTVAL